MYMCVYIHIYIHIHIHVCIYMCIYTYIYIYIYTKLSSYRRAFSIGLSASLKREAAADTMWYQQCRASELQASIL